ncbi:MAG TPA: hypothetical protein VEW95_05390 [Candidatus Limnocylindrales bacterium]|nr:hypothetical protein [Candidatus Limnocylindrales bacterium]
MNRFFGRHINNTIDVVTLLVLGAISAGLYFAVGFDPRSMFLTYALIRVLTIGYVADKHFNAYLDARYGRRER